MEFAKKYGSNAKRGNQGYGLGLVRNASFGRKRVALPDVCIDFGDNDDDCISITPLKRRCSGDLSSVSQKSSLEDLPQEILIKILCGVEHEDLKGIFFVSKALREAALIAKQTHFAYSTPQKALMFQEDYGDFYEVKVPNAPKQSRVPCARLSAKKLSDVSIALFVSDDDEAVWARRDVCVDMETMV